MTRFKVETKKVEVYNLSKTRLNIELPLDDMKRDESFVVPINLALTVRGKIQGAKRKHSKRKFTTRMTHDRMKLRVWRTK